MPPGGGTIFALTSSTGSGSGGFIPLRTRPYPVL